MSEAELLSKRIEGLHIQAKQKVSSFLSGNRRSLFLGNGTEFSDLREYQTGDDLRFIDWRATAKRYNSLIVRDFEVERNTNVILLLDNSASMMLGKKAPRMKSAIIGVASLVHAAIQNKDFFGFGAFTTNLIEYIPPKGGKGHEFLIYKKLLNLIPQGETDLAEALKRTVTSLPRRSIILILTDLHSTSEQMMHAFTLAKAFKHEVQVIQLTDFGEYTLPDKIGKVKFQDQKSKSQVVADFNDPITSGLYYYDISQKIQELNNFKRKLRSLNVKILEGYTDDLPEKILLSYFSLKQKGY